MELIPTNNKIIQDWTPPFIAEINAEKVRMGIHHNHTRAPRKARARYRYQGGEIQVIGVIMSKSEVMTHKGKGKFQERGNRKEKPWFNPIAEKRTSELADALAQNTGDVICGNILIR